MYIYIYVYICICIYIYIYICIYIHIHTHTHVSVLATAEVARRSPGARARSTLDLPTKIIPFLLFGIGTRAYRELVVHHRAL